MKARTFVLYLCLSVLACEDDLVAPTASMVDVTHNRASESRPTVLEPESRTTVFKPDLSTSFAVRVYPSDTDGLVQRNRVGWDDAPVATVEGLLVLSPGALPAVELRGPRLLLSSPHAVVQALARAYGTRDTDLFELLLAQDPERNAEFLFLLSEPTVLGETQWGYQEEARIHQRMFHPESPPPGDPPVPADLWLQAVVITLIPAENFSERPDLYSENGGLDGKLDPAIWRAMDARYTTYVFFDFTGTDYKVEGEANFIVLDDRTKSTGAAGKFSIYVWEDIRPVLRQAGITAVEQQTWGNVKGLFR